MLIAKQLKKSNIAEYLIYMWQVEDLIRANQCNIDVIDRQVVSRFPEEVRDEMHEWYANLTNMMVTEGIKEHGHLQILQGLLQNLTELHARLLASTKYPFYNAAYFKALPFIVELRQRGGGQAQQESELETCFGALYGVLMLRLSKKEVSPGTSQAVKAISSMLSLLANYYEKGIEEDD